MTATEPTRTPEQRGPQARGALVLGATGYLGRHICTALDAAGFTVTGVARRRPPGPAGPVLVPLDVHESDPGRLTRLLADCGAEVVVNAAGAVWHGDEAEMDRANAALVRAVVAAAGALPRPPRVVHLGSAYEYMPLPRGRDTREDTPCRPTTAYGRSKLRGTRVLLDAVTAGTVPGVVLRVANVSGPGAPPTSLLGRVAGHLARAAAAPAAGPPRELRLGPLRTVRDYTDVRDVASAAVAAALLPAGADAGVVNVGSGRAVEVRRLVDRLVRLSGLPVPVVADPRLGSRRSELDWQRLDAGRAGRLLGWRPARSLDDSLRDLLRERGVAPAANVAPETFEEGSSPVPNTPDAAPRQA